MCLQNFERIKTLRSIDKIIMDHSNTTTDYASVQGIGIAHTRVKIEAREEFLDGAYRAVSATKPKRSSGGFEPQTNP